MLSAYCIDVEIHIIRHNLISVAVLVCHFNFPLAVEHLDAHIHSIICHLLVDVHLYKLFTCLDINKIRLNHSISVSDIILARRQALFLHIDGYFSDEICKVTQV